MQQKKNISISQLRRKAHGKELRKNMTRVILDKTPAFPLAVELKDIDEEFERWVKEDIDVSFDGKRLPTFKLFSNQRINEYAQTWAHVDQTGNPLMNFKTVTRDNNPKKGENQGKNFNIPGDRRYTMFSVPVLQENGLEAYDVYTMKQPFSVDLVYSVSVITNKYELLNLMNQTMNDKFKAIDCYISPHGHFMPMVLDDVSDESEYGIDDRKYYSQTYKITVRGYIIKQDDFEVVHAPSRLVVNVLPKESKKARSYVEEYSEAYECSYEEENNLEPKGYTYKVHIPLCEEEVSFIMQTDLFVTEVMFENIEDIDFYINGEKTPIEDAVELLEGDSIRVVLSKRGKDISESILTIKGVNRKDLLNIEDDDLWPDSKEIVV